MNARMIRRAAVLGLFLLILAGAGMGWWVLGEYFARECGRLSTGELLIAFSGDLTALFWFAVYLVRHVVLGIPIENPGGSRQRKIRLSALAIASMLASLGMDLVVTFWLRGSEHAAFKEARLADGTIDSRRMYGARFRLDCSFTDADGVVHRPVFYVRQPAELAHFDHPVAAAILADRLPAPVRIAYSPHRPARSWLAGVPQHDKRMHTISLIVLIFQAVACLCFIISLFPFSDVELLPWWHDLHGVVLVAIEAGLVLGLVMLKWHEPPLFWADL